MSKKYWRNVPHWHPAENDYVLVFMPVDGLWIEVGHDIPKYKNMTLADYLQHMNIIVPDWTQFLRVIDEERRMLFEYRAYDALRVVIKVSIDK